jgi:hypothetical protein
VSSRFAPASRPRYDRAMCGRARLSSDVSEIKLVFSIPPHRPTPNYSEDGNDLLIDVSFEVADEAAAFSAQFNGESTQPP